MTRKFIFALILICLLAFNLQAAQIESTRLSETVKVLASDEFEGRAPGSPGEEKTVPYLIQRFADLGLQPGGENGTWTQAVPLFRTR